MPRTAIAPVFAHMRLAKADKLALTSLFTAVIDDNDLLRARLNAAFAKLDAAGATVAGLGTNYAATLAIQPTAVNLVK